MLVTSTVGLCRSHWQTYLRSKGPKTLLFFLKKKFLISAQSDNQSTITFKVTKLKFFACCEQVEDFLPADAFAQEQVELGEAKETMTKA